MEASGFSEWFSQWARHLSSDDALFIYSWVAIGTAALMSIALASYQLRIIRDFNQADIERRYRGRKPEKPETIQKRIDETERYANRTLQILFSRAFLVLTFGVAVPGLVLVSIAWYQDWLFAGAPALQMSGTPIRPQDASAAELILFAVDQALRGGLTDLFEVFSLSVADVTNNPGNVLFSTLVLAYRILCGAAAIGLLAMLGRVALGVWGLSESIKQLKLDLQEAEAN